MEIASAFGVEPTHWEPIVGGDANTSCLLTDKKKHYVLTVLKDDARMSPDSMRELLETVAAQGIPVCLPLRTSDGDSHTTWQGHLAVLKPFAEGQCGTLPLPLLEAAAALLARIHLVQPPPGIMPEKTQTFDYSRLEDIVGFAPPEFVSWLRVSLESTDHVETDVVPQGLVHSDFWPDNIVVSPEQSFTIIDWENTAVGNFTFDIAWALPGLVLNKADYSVDTTRLRSFFRGYESVRPLQPEERDILGDTLLRTSAMIACHRFRRHHVTKPDPSLYDPDKYGKYEETVKIGKAARSLIFSQ